jgi:hypothetical protein
MIDAVLTGVYWGISVTVFFATISAAAALAVYIMEKIEMKAFGKIWRPKDDD